MKNILLLLTVILCLDSAHAIYKVPEEVLLLQIPKATTQLWKEFNRDVTKDIVISEWIPLDQSVDSYQDYVRLHYQDLTTHKPIPSARAAFDMIRSNLESCYPKKRTHINILSQTDTDIIYEWTLTKKYKGEPPQHEISHLFYGKNGLHIVSYTHIGKKIPENKREIWLAAIAAAAPVAHAWGKTEQIGLSLAQNLRTYFDLGDAFSKWELVEFLLAKKTETVVMRIPKGHPKLDISEAIEERASPMIHGKLSINDCFEIEKTQIKNSTGWKDVDFTVLEKTPTEIIYTYSHQSLPEDPMIINAVVRTHISNSGYYSIAYRKGLDRKVSDEKFAEWAETLKQVQLVAQEPRRVIRRPVGTTATKQKK